MAVVTPFKLLGANYGAVYTQWIIDGLLNAATVDFQKSTGHGFGDIYVQPLILGWSLSSGDITAGYSFFAPTGAGTSGQHMWVHELNLGGTLNLGEGKKMERVHNVLLGLQPEKEQRRHKSRKDSHVGGRNWKGRNGS